MIKRIASVLLSLSMAVHALDPIPPPAVIKAEMEQKMNLLILQRLDAEGLTFGETLDVIRTRSREIDIYELDPAQRGFNFVVFKFPAGDSAKIVLHQKQASVAQVVSELCKQSKMKFWIEPNFIGFCPEGEMPPRMILNAKGKGWEKASFFTIPRIDYEDATLGEVIDFYNVRISEATGGAADDRLKLEVKFDTTADRQAMIHELKIRNVRLPEVLCITAMMTGHRLRFDADAVVFYR